MRDSPSPGQVSVVALASALLVQSAAVAGSVPDWRTDLEKSKAPLFYTACDQSIDGQLDRFIWIFGSRLGFELVYRARDRVFDELIGFEVSDDGKSMLNEIDVGQSVEMELGVFGEPHSPVNFPPANATFALIMPGDDYLASIVANKDVKACAF